MRSLPPQPTRTIERKGRRTRDALFILFRSDAALLAAVRRPCGLRLAAAFVQDPFGIAIGLLGALEDQVAGGVPGRALEFRRHGTVERITRILPVHHLRHAA